MVLAASYKKDKDWNETIAVCQSMIASGSGGVWPYIELAKYYEHIEKDIHRALSYANSALSYSLNTAPILKGSSIQQEQIMRRIERLRRKQRLNR